MRARLRWLGDNQRRDSLSSLPLWNLRSDYERSKLLLQLSDRALLPSSLQLLPLPAPLLSPHGRRRFPLCE